MQFLCIPATSAPSERLWSIASIILTKERNRLDSETVAPLVFRKENGHILEIYISKKLTEEIEYFLKYLLNKKL